MAIKKLLAKQLSHRCDPEQFDFDTTDEISFETQLINQKRAEETLDFGLNIKSDGYNIYVSGQAGTGRNTSVKKAVHDIAKNEKVPNDICYIYNFKTPDEPRVIMLPVGKGVQFKKDVELLINELVTEIQKSLESQEYEEMARSIQTDYEQKKDEESNTLEKIAHEKGFVLKQTVTGIAILPVVDNQLMSEDEYNNLSDSEKHEITESQKIVQDKLNAAIQLIKEFDRELKDALKDLDEKVALYAVGDLIKEVKSLYDNSPEIKNHLDQIQDDIIVNIDVFKKEKKSPELPFMESEPKSDKVLKKYEVNLIVDNSETQGVPVIIEHNPSYYNLIGRMEYIAQLGVMITDFTLIKAGALLKANGGYLILQAMDLLKDPFAWDALKKVLKHKTLKIEDINERYRVISTQGLKPQSIPIDVKVILVGPPWIYYMLYHYDKEDFRKIFKIRADFEMDMERTDENSNKYLYFVASKAKENNLYPFDRKAVARIIDYGSRISDHQKKLTAQFSKINDILLEADYWAKNENAKVISEDHVKKAINHKKYRSDMIEEKIYELMEDGTLLVDVKGEKVGQINALSILQLGDYSFGKPSKITVQTFYGKGAFINIEREVKMSGAIHNKGLLILQGYFGSEFATDKAIHVSASICFEQLYDGVDGDSASSTELYGLLSSLADVPIAQDIAVTGSVNQIGEIQPIGGVNQKIEGFYSICKLKGFTKKQGVIIPKQNVVNLMLNDEIIEAVKKGRFHIYAISHVDEGIEILTGKPAGEKDKNGNYKKGTIKYLVNEQLKKYASIMSPIKKVVKKPLKTVTKKTEKKVTKRDRKKVAKKAVKK